jgi:hypothetical protein
VDLSRIESWTKQRLEQEARRRGIKNPEFRTHAELVRLILKHQYGNRVAQGRERVARGRRAFKDARSLLGTVVGATLSSLPEPLETLLRSRGGTPLPKEPPARPGHLVSAPPREGAGTEAGTEAGAGSGAVPESGATSETGSETESGAVSESVSASETLSETGAESEAESESVSASGAGTETGAVSVCGSVSGSEAGTGSGAVSEAKSESLPTAGTPIPQPSWPAPPPPLREASTQTFEQEPIRTRSMARLLASQGHRERALAIYEELLARDSTDARLQAEAEAVRDGETPPAPSMPAPGRELELPERPDRIECQGGADEGLRVRWQVSEDGRRRARAVLGHDGELAVRLVTIRPDAQRVVRSEITEHGPVDEQGEWTAERVQGPARCFAAIGLRDGDRFVSIAHVRPH